MRLPRFDYGDHVLLVPNDRVPARVVDLHYFGQTDTNEYTVTYYHDGRDFKVRCMEDELEFNPAKERRMDERLLQFFNYDHLPEALQAVSKPFAQLAFHVTEFVPASPERTVSLRKLLEAKDAAVRAAVYPGK